MFVFLAMVIYGAGQLFGQESTLQDEVVALKFTYPDSIGVGDTLVFEIELSVKDGWHIFSPDAINRQQGMEPFSIQYAKLPAWIKPVGELIYPPGIRYGENQVYMGKGHRLVQKFLIAPDSPRGSYSFRGRVIYQGCDANVCFPPLELSFVRRVSITDEVLEN